MGNEAIGLGALHAGVNFVSGYPGTPSTEVLETVAANNPGDVHVEWSTNEKAALEAAAGAAYSGARALVTMKQVGLNVASDPLMTLSYLGVEGGLVIVVADDPGPISSQTEQDTRSFAQFAKVPVLDPANAGEAYGMVQDAFELSEQYNTPVIVRPVTRVCHGYGTVKTRGGIADCGGTFDNADLADDDPSWEKHTPAGFTRDTQRWVVFPRTSYENHGKVERRAMALAGEFSYNFHHNRIEVNGRRFGGLAGKHYPFGIVCGGISYYYVKEALELVGADAPLLKIGAPYPFPDMLAGEFMQGVDELLVVEELDPFIERELLVSCGKRGLQRRIHGKLDGTFPYAGEQSPEAIVAALGHFGAPAPAQHGLTVSPDVPVPELPTRPPVLCAGCPHRASFYAVKRAVGKRKAVFCGDIGCYTLGNAMPLDMVDTCLCMGAGITVPQGIRAANPDTLCFGFVGDSTFFASGLTGIVNAVYNEHDIIVCVLDNSTTAMTGHQPHPGTGHTMMGTDSMAQSIPGVLEALGVSCTVVNPLDLNASIAAVRAAMRGSGVRAIVFSSPCIYAAKPTTVPVSVDAATCVGCHACIQQIGCPALSVSGEGDIVVDASLCTGCGLCAQVCPTNALREGGAR